MVIRCERCSTTYELEESLLAPTGSQVQCTKCQHVFTAFPLGAAHRTLPGTTEQPSPTQAPRPREPARAAEPERAAPQPAAAARPEKPHAHRAPWNAVPPVYRPPVPSAPRVRAPAMGRDAVGMVEARIRSSARRRRLVPIAAAALVVAGAAGWLVFSRRGDPGAERARAERAHTDALALIALDDADSLDRASATLDEGARGARPGSAAAERALSIVLRAAAAGDEGESLAGRAARLADERDRLVREQSPGWEPASRTLAAESAAIEAEVRAREERASALGRSASEAIRAAQAEAGDTREVARALALHHAWRGERDRALAIVHAARQRGGDDPWLEMAEAWLEARDPDRGARERAAVKLARLASTRPDLLRGRYLLARTQASLGARAEAIATLDALLAANPRHEAARRLRDDIAAQAAVQAHALPAPGKAPPQPRKSVSHAGEGAGPQPPNGTAAPAPSTAVPRPAPAPSGSPSAPPPRATSSPLEGVPATEPPSPPAAAPATPPAAEPPPSPPPAPPPPHRRAAPSFDPPEPTNGG